MILSKQYSIQQKKRKEKIEKKEERRYSPSEGLGSIKKSLSLLSSGLGAHTYIFVTAVCIPNEDVGNEKMLERYKI